RCARLGQRAVSCLLLYWDWRRDRPLAILINVVQPGCSRAATLSDVQAHAAPGTGDEPNIIRHISSLDRGSTIIGTKTYATHESQFCFSSLMPAVLGRARARFHPRLVCPVTHFDRPSASNASSSAH